MSKLTQQWYHYEKNPITGKFAVWNLLGDHIGTYDSETEAAKVAHEKSWEFELRYCDEQKDVTQERKETLEQAGWKIYVQSYDNRVTVWTQGYAFTPDGFKASTRLYYEHENVSEEKILQEIVNKAWVHYIKD